MYQIKTITLTTSQRLTIYVVRMLSIMLYKHKQKTKLFSKPITASTNISAKQVTIKTYTFNNAIKTRKQINKLTNKN